MARDNPTPITQEELERKLENGESLKGVVIGDANFSEHTYDETLDFSGTIIQGVINFRSCKFTANTMVNFSKAQFSGNARANFREAQFSDKAKAYFRSSKFSDNAWADFRGAKFSGETEVDFSRVQLSDKAQAIFSGARFSEKAGAELLEAQFSNKSQVNFASAQFADRARAVFTRALFSDQVRVGFTSAQFTDQARVVFNRAHFSGEAQADFNVARFSEKALAVFNRAHFSEKSLAVFTMAQFKDTSEFLWINTRLSNQDLFNFTNMNCADTANVRFESVDLSRASFYLTDIESFTFKNITWGKVFGGFIPRFVLKDEELFEINQEKELKELDENPELSEAEKKRKKREMEINYFRQVEILYRQLKRNYEENRDYHGAGDFHFGEVEMRRRQKTWLRQWSSLTLPYRLLSGYGEKWGRALLSFVIAVLLFASLNLLWIQPKEYPSNKWEQAGPVGKVVESSLFTFKLMTLQRNLKYEPVDDPVWGRVGKFVLNLEFLIGPALIALMLLAIRRQFRR